MPAPLREGYLETIDGVVEDVRGPFADGTAEIIVRRPTGEIEVVVLSASQVAALLEEEHKTN